MYLHQRTQDPVSCPLTAGGSLEGARCQHNRRTGTRSCGSIQPHVIQTHSWRHRSTVDAWDTWMRNVCAWSVPGWTWTKSNHIISAWSPVFFCISLFLWVTHVGYRPTVFTSLIILAVKIINYGPQCADIFGRALHVHSLQYCRHFFALAQPSSCVSPLQWEPVSWCDLLVHCLTTSWDAPCKQENNKICSLFTYWWEIIWATLKQMTSASFLIAFISSFTARASFDNV